VWLRVGKLNPARRSIWSEHLLTLTNRLVTPKRWLAECIANHKDCANLVGYSSCYPKRLLDLQLSGSADNPNSGIKLINSNTIHGRPTYATLSHCWGISPQHNQGGVLKTTRVTQRQHEDGIPLASLPKTFLDAVILASELSIPYLWIDSLCIIQDDTACWESEAADMAAYYQNSHLTIAATSAKDSSEGCYLTITNHDLRVPLPPRNHNTQNRGAQSHHVRFAMRWIDRAQGFISHSLSSNSALSQRAWALQELVLSRRTIHCFNSQFYWNCRHHSESEDGSMTLEGLNPVYARYTSPRFSGSVPEFLELAHWHSLVERYIVSVLTFERDRLAAFAGITKHFQAHLGDEPMLGAWKRTAAFDLHWRRWHPKMEVPYTLAAYGVSSYPQIPSWSWLTVRPHPDPTSRAGRIVFLIYAARTLGTPLAFHYTTHTQVVAYEESWSGHPMTSTLAYANLTIQGPLIPIRSLPTREQGANVQYHLDDPRDNDDEGLLCLHLYGIQVTCSEGTRKEYFRWFMGFLLVRIVLQEPLTCRRIGAAMIETQGSPWLAWLCGAENQVIRMV